MECLHPNDEHYHSDNEWSAMIRTYDSKAMEATSKHVTELKEKIKKHYHAHYEFDPYVNCAVALQRCYAGHAAEGSEDGYSMTLFRYFACMLIQWVLLLTLLRDHVWKDPDAEKWTGMFIAASLCACLAFVAQAAVEWKEVFHLLEMVYAGAESSSARGASCLVLVLAVLPKVLFALVFTFLAPCGFLDSDHTSEIVLNCTAFMFLLQVKNLIFKASGGRLETDEFDDLADRVQKSFFHIPDTDIVMSSSPRQDGYDKNKFDSDYEERRTRQRIKGFVISFVISSVGYIVFKRMISNSSTATTPSPTIFP